MGLFFLVGKIILENSIRTNLQKSIGPGFTLEKIHLKFTYISGLNATYVDPQSNKKLFHIGEIRIIPVLSSLLKKTIVITKIEVNKPYLYIYKTPKEKIIAPGVSIEGKKKEEKVPSKRTIAIKGTQIINGTLSFSDNAIRNPPSQLDINNIALFINNLQIPIVSSKTPIDLKGVLNEGGEVSLGGWVDLKSQNADLSLNIKGADIKPFEPYIASSVPIMVNSGKAYLTSQIVVEDKKLSMPGTLEIINLQIKADHKRQAEILNNQMDSLLNLDKDKIKVEFQVNGDLSSPNFDFTKAVVLALTKSFGDILGRQLKEGAIQKGKKSLKEILPRNK